jgi:hypothetical protein
MKAEGHQEIDPLERSAPRPPTFAEQRTIAVLGALAIVIAAGVLVRVLGSGATPTSAADELGAARPVQTHPAAAPARAGE